MELGCLLGLGLDKTSSSEEWSLIKIKCYLMFNYSGYLLAKPRQIVLLLVFGFDVDTLEIALREQESLVNKIFLVESTKTHKGV